VEDELTESYNHGMRQKLLISSALVRRPEVIVVDEPLVGLDPKARTLKDLLRAFVRKGGTVLMSAHAGDRGGDVRPRGHHPRRPPDRIGT
jgi:ABC-2 type transport system ATP-binding protein